jgi:Rab-GTPase-TBC domain
MDYVVAHLLRILQDTVRWSAATGKLPGVMLSAPTAHLRADMMSPDLSSQQRLKVYNDIDRSFVVEEACFRVMDSFLSVYNLRHFYWPELRCLKTCCLVFERLIKIKLPVLADHFEHHELNVGLFALGWFQTLFLYLPSMPSATVCHMWDIWLVERSFKIFFRVGTAILFLSQPILLNHSLDEMMIYLNTFPDSTLLSPDILIACALQIKVTNRLLMELEREVTAPAAAHVQ